METALYDIYALVVLLYQKSPSFDFPYDNNLCTNGVHENFP